jgi:hypothetical protein
MLKRMKPAGKRKAARLREEKVKPKAPDDGIHPSNPICFLF